MPQPIPDIIKKGEVLILVFEIDSTQEKWSDYDKTLSKNEKNKANEFQYLDDKLSFTKCRSILRSTLSKWLNCGPSEINIIHRENGKPYLEHSKVIEFNITHTKGLAAIAFSIDSEVGIDVENLNREINLDQVAKKVFTTSEQSLINANNQNDKKKMFYRLWTSKESYLKATGLGFRVDPRKISVDPPIENKKHGKLKCENDLNSHTLRLIELKCPDPHIMTLCAPETSQSINTLFL
jgi:4'-phosphopantetheinyl transferase